METTINPVRTKAQILVFLLISVLITSLIFAVDSDSSQGRALDSILASVLLIGWFTFAQVGLSKLIGKRLHGWIKVLTSVIGEILVGLGIYVLLYTILYLVKF